LKLASQENKYSWASIAYQVEVNQSITNPFHWTKFDPTLTYKSYGYILLMLIITNLWF
jgi:hypothetical protein